MTINSYPMRIWDLSHDIKKLLLQRRNGWTFGELVKALRKPDTDVDAALDLMQFEKGNILVDIRAGEPYYRWHVQNGHFADDPAPEETP